MNHRRLLPAGQNSEFSPKVCLAGWFFSAFIFLLGGNPAGAQVLSNGGFESGLTGWTTSLSNGGAATFAYDSTNIRSGTNSLKVTVTSAGSTTNAVQLVSPSFIATSTNTYVLRIWLNSEKVGANLGVNLLGATPAYPQISFKISTNSLASGAKHYQEYLYAFKASGTVSIAFNFQTAGQYWLDDVEVLDVVNNDGWDVPMTYLWQWGQWNFAQTNSAKIGWTGGDNDKSCQLPDGSVAWIFNDSFSSTLNSFYSNIRGGSSLPRNVLVHQIGTNLVYLNNGNNTYFVPEKATGSQMPSTAAGGIYWIGGSIAESNKFYVLLNGLGFGSFYTNVCMSVATFSLPGLTLDGLVTNLTSPGTDNFGDLVKGDDGYYYIYNNTNNGTSRVARVPAGQLATDSAWTYWNGSTWVANHTQSVPIPNFQGWSITRMGISNYVAIYHPILSLDIYAQFAPSPMGPWGYDVKLATAGDQGAQGIMGCYMPNLCMGTGSNGVYTIGYSDNGGDTEGWGTKLSNDKSWYNPHFVTANLRALSPYTLNYGVGGPTSRMSIKLAADQNYNHNYIDNTYGAGASNTTNWFNIGINGGGSGVTNVPYYNYNGQKYASGTKIVYSWLSEKTHTVDNAAKSNNVALLESWINVNNNCWYLSVTNLDAPFTNGYSVCFYYHGSTTGYGGQNYVRYYAGQTTNTTVLGTRQWNLYTTDASNNGTFVQDLTPANSGTSGETASANYFVFTNLTGGAFDLLITNGNFGGVNAIEIVANTAVTTGTLTVSAANVPYGTPVIVTNQVSPAPPDGENVVFMDGTTALGTNTLTAGSAIFIASTLAVGSHPLTAVYGGDGNYLASTSSVAMVTVVAIPTVSAPLALPASNVYVGTNVILVCSNYTGTPPYNFQWQASGDGVVYTNVNGALTNQMTLAGVTSSNSGYYRLAFTASSLSVTSAVVQLTVNPLPVLGAQPDGGNVILSWSQGTLLQATNLSGPWTTNNATSPFTNQPLYPQMFYRILGQ